jgi:hypothetical protein
MISVEMPSRIYMQRKQQDSSSEAKSRKMFERMS